MHLIEQQFNNTMIIDQIKYFNKKCNRTFFLFHLSKKLGILFLYVLKSQHNGTGNYEFNL